MRAGAAVVSAVALRRVTPVRLPCASWANVTVPPRWSVVATVSPSTFVVTVRVWFRGLVWVVAKPS